ncbi:unnamed protein product [Angiostrongylus costaricensis]|uniref:Amine oxidase n=1 Tax=Angiostrongylus costaricensis TaxID=334426 RepID=A0A0R3PPV2_ANGCS|nr:unnamed protein product [Angiostrongylus costaricensis]
MTDAVIWEYTSAAIRFDNVNNTYNYAKHSRYDEMYHPYLGSFRERRMFTTLAPSLCIPKRNRSCSYELVPHKAYRPKQGEWLVERDRTWVKEEALKKITVVVVNYFRYWRGRACGLDYIAPFLHPPDYRPAEDRRYHRIFWAPEFLSITPSCRHAAGFMLTAY